MTGILNLLMGTVRSAGVTADPYFEYTTLLLPGSGTNGAQNNTFLDSGTANGGVGFPITRNPLTGPNAPTQGTFSPFSQTGWGNYFNGSSAFGTSDVATDFQSGDFTIEAWVYLSSLSTVAPVVNGFNTSVGLQITTNAELELFQWTGSAYSINIKSSVSAVALNTWVHVVGVRSGSNASVYVNGSRLATSTTVSGTQVSTGSTLVGRNSGSTRWVSGYISNLRIVKGTAVYDPTQTTLTVPTSPLTAISGTSLLTCQSNRFIDNSTNNYSISLTGTPTVVAFSPFNPTASWSAATNGGSGYFDGSGDYLSVPDNAALELGSGDFCIEGWVYLTANSGSGIAFAAKNGGSFASWQIQANSTNWLYYLSSNGSTWNVSSGVTMGAASLNTWTHIALVRNSGVITPYINGVAGTTTTSSATIFNNSRDLTIGTVEGSAGSFSQYLTGYVSNFRLVVGSPVYTAAFTPPTAPLTAITNTSLLLNFTNAGIYDATSKNDLETVADAQISNTTAKWGSTSIKFDGTGDYLPIPSSQFNLFAFNTSDFTLEAWIYPTALSGDDVIISSYYSWAGSVNFYFGTRSGSPNVLLFRAGDSLPISILGNTAVNLNEWCHVAVTRSSGVTRMFVNGVTQTATHTGSVNISGTVAPIFVGANNNASEFWTGYMQDVRVTKGYARYTANFTPPTAAFPTL